MSSWGSPLLDPKKLQNEQFFIIDWIRKKLLVDVANLAPCCHDDYDVLLEVLGTLGKCYVSNPVAKTLVWIENHDWHNCFCMSSWGSLTLTGPKKASKWTVLHNRLNKEKTPGRCCQSGSLLLTAPCCSLLLLAAAYLLLTCCCSPAAHPDSLHWDHHPRGIHRGNKKLA